MQQSIDSQPIALTVRVSADRQQQQKKYIPIGLKKPNIYKLPSSCNLLPVCCCCYLLPRRRAGWITGAVVKKKRRFIMDSRCAGFFLFKKSAQLGRGSPCVLGQVGHQQNEESKTQRLPREEIIRRMLFFSFSSTLSSVTFLLLAAFTLTHAKEQVSQSNQRASFFFPLFRSGEVGRTGRERERGTPWKH